MSVDLIPNYGTLSKEEQATNHETWVHIYAVQKLMHIAAKEMLDRIESHDQSKLSAPEVDTFTKYTPILKNLEYGSQEYMDCLKHMKPALDNHYACNRHHPEHFENGLSGMNLFDVLEMVIDWKASSLRTKNGDITKSLDIQLDRFGISPQLFDIIKNTVDHLETCLN